MAEYYWMNKEHGYLILETELYTDAEECGYDDVTDPTSCEYRNFELHYTKTNYRVNWRGYPKIRC